MKVWELAAASAPNIILTNEEQKFVVEHMGVTEIQGLGERDQWVAQSLVRKGVYRTSKDGKKIALASGRSL